MTTSSALIMCLTVAAAHATESGQADPVVAAREWIAAVRAQDEAQLTTRTSVPFVEEGLREKPCRAKGRATTEAEVSKVAACIFKRKLLVESIPENKPEYFDDWKVTKLSEVRPKRFRRKLAPLAKNHSIVTGSLGGDGVTFLVAFAVRSDGRIDMVLADADYFE